MNKFLLPVAIIIGASVIAGGLYFGISQNQSPVEDNIIVETSIEEEVVETDQIVLDEIEEENQDDVKNSEPDQLQVQKLIIDTVTETQTIIEPKVEEEVLIEEPVVVPPPAVPSECIDSVAMGAYIGEITSINLYRIYYRCIAYWDSATISSILDLINRTKVIEEQEALNEQQDAALEEWNQCDGEYSALLQTLNLSPADIRIIYPYQEWMNRCMDS